jgi:DNA modification methylase
MTEDLLEARILVGDAVTRMRELPDGVARTCVTSPPYWGLRDYGESGQLGLEATTQEFVDNLCKVFDEVWRVLADDGTCWVNLGDTYVEKSLAGIPWRFAFAMQDRGWYLRQDIIWAKPNPMPEPVKDRCVKSHEYVFLLTKNARYYFDYEAISEPISDKNKTHYQKYAGMASKKQPKAQGVRNDGGGNGTHSGFSTPDTEKRRKRSVWNVSTASFKGAHFAVYPPALIEPCILAGSGEGDTVLDPFSGSGTTGEVALKNGRNYVGCEINPEYAQLSVKRIGEAVGMFGEVRSI